MKIRFEFRDRGNEGRKNILKSLDVSPPSTKPASGDLTTNGFLERESGFTLLELMISIAIVGIMVFILMAVLRLGFRSVEAGEKKIESLGRVKASLNVIDAQIQSEIPLTFDQDGEKQYYFKGKPDSLEFSTNYSIWEGEKGFVVVTYKVIIDDRGKRTLQASENKVWREDRKEIKLLEFFDEMSFEYYFQDPTEEEGRWIKEWTEAGFLPKKILLRLVKDRKDLSIILPLKTEGILAESLAIQGQGGVIKKQ
jgi:general secretion pathway protein J